MVLEDSTRMHPSSMSMNSSTLGDNVQTKSNRAGKDLSYLPHYQNVHITRKCLSLSDNQLQSSFSSKKKKSSQNSDASSESSFSPTYLKKSYRLQPVRYSENIHKKNEFVRHSQEKCTEKSHSDELRISLGNGCDRISSPCRVSSFEFENDNSDAFPEERCMTNDAVSSSSGNTSEDAIELIHSEGVNRCQISILEHRPNIEKHDQIHSQFQKSGDDVSLSKGRKESRDKCSSRSVLRKSAMSFFTKTTKSNLPNIPSFKLPTIPSLSTATSSRSIAGLIQFPKLETASLNCACSTPNIEIYEDAESFDSIWLQNTGSTEQNTSCDFMGMSSASPRGSERLIQPNSKSQRPYIEELSMPYLDN